ncbi:MAG: hypothetical protein MZW92_80010 [Comamonadaceae bacterium]|nr:hypothetical protein [Comamonadaceae bacterium]
MPGMFARAHFVTGRAKKLLVPAQSVLHRGEVTAVYVVDAQGLPQLRQVRLGEPVADASGGSAGRRHGRRTCRPRPGESRNFPQANSREALKYRVENEDRIPASRLFIATKEGNVAHIVIMGAGIGGMPMAYEMREQRAPAGQGHRRLERPELPLRAVQPLGCA